MAKNSTSVSVGPSGTTLLTIIFVLLKDFGYISWPWWWVLSPLWISAILVIGTLLFVFAIAILSRGS